MSSKPVVHALANAAAPSLREWVNAHGEEVEGVVDAARRLLHSSKLNRTHHIGAYRVVPVLEDNEIYWVVEADLYAPDDTSRRFGRVRYGATLTFARADGAFSEPDGERLIPDSVRDRLDSLAGRLTKAGLY